MAVRRGFEPRMQLLTAYSLSRGAPSASRPPHQHASCECFEELVSAHRRCVAHILLSGTYKSNNFSRAFIVCTFHAQLVCKNGKKSVLSTDKLAISWSSEQTETSQEKALRAVESKKWGRRRRKEKKREEKGSLNQVAPHQRGETRKP